MLVKAPLKLNLSLRIGKKLKNGYHDLESVFHSVRIFETLRIVPNKKGVINLSCNDSSVPLDHRNTVSMALNFIGKHYPGSDIGLDIHITKAVAPGTGLGGGSSDAAGVIYYLEKTSRLTADQAFNIAALTGADVPFCLHAVKAMDADGQRICAKVQGIGDKIESTDPFEGFFVICIPEKLSISTKEAFEKFDRNECGYSQDSIFPEIGENDFEKILSAEEHRVVSRAKNYLNEIGAEFSMMSGSGSSVIGYFSAKPVIIGPELTDYRLLTEEEEH